MRADDDKIIYKLNTSLPTTSFADQVSATEHCKGLYEQVGLIVHKGGSQLEMINILTFDLCGAAVITSLLLR